MIDQFDGDYEFLSNFFSSPVVCDGVEYPTLEHGYQAAKTLGSRKEILECGSPGRAKHLGKKVPLRPGWEEIKLGIMLELLRSKFSNPELRRKLVETGSHELIEGNSWGDIYWGMCNGKGRNMLGKLLMVVRNEVSDGE